MLLTRNSHICTLITTTLQPPTATTLATQILTTPTPNHLTETLLTHHTHNHLTPHLVTQTLKHLQSHPPKALLLFSLLSSHPLLSSTLSLPSFHAALHISGRAHNFPLLWSILAQLKAHPHLSPTQLTLSIILQSYVLAKKPEKAIHVFLSHSTSSSSTSSFNDLLDILCKYKRPEMAHGLLKAHGKDFNADVISYNIIVNGYCLVKQTNKAVKVLREMVERGVGVTISTYNAMLKGYVRAGQMTEASRFFLEMKRRNVGVDVISYTTMIHGYGTRGEVGRARRLFEEMGRVGVLPTVATYNVIIQVLCRSGDDGGVESAVGVLEEMGRRGYVANLMTYNLLVRGFCECGERDRAVEFVEVVMRREGCEPSVQTFNMLVRSYCDAGEIEEGLGLFEKMGLGECLPNLDTYNVLISSLFARRKGEDLVVAGRLLVEMVEREFVPTKLMFNRVIDGLLATGNQGFAREILRVLSESGKLPRHFRL